MKYLIFALPKPAQNEASFNAWNRIANQFYKYPNDIGTAQYTIPIYHPNKPFVAFPMLANNVLDSGQIEFRGKLSFALNVVDELSEDWFSVSSSLSST